MRLNLLSMPLRLVLLSALFAFCACSSQKTLTASVPVSAENSAENTSEWLSTNRVLIVFYEGGLGRRHLMKQVKKLNCSIIYDYHNFNAVALKVPEKASIDEVIARLRQTKGVLQVSRDHMYKLDAR